MYTLIFYFLFISILVTLLGRFLGREISIKLNLFFLLLSLFMSLIIFYESLRFSVVEIELFNWINVLGLNITFSLFYDFLSSSMLLLVITISFLVHIYSYNYMHLDPSKVRFFCFLSLFTTFMGILVVSDSLVQFFFAWEGVGITSFLLINFWYTRYEANRSAMKAVFINRFGDFGLYVGLLMFIIYFKTHSFTAINSLSYIIKNEDFMFVLLGQKLDLITFLSLFIFLGIVGKSAQLGLHTWLPDAMEGPTPVSALLHAATMVTAGIYLMLRLSLFYQFSDIMLFISFWGALTAFIASTIGTFQNDIKKIIAYSTCSQLGYMLASCGLYNFIGAYFHLFNHAFFKALLFLGAGSVIHAMGDEQDLRKYGGLLNFLPFTHIALLIGSISLMGVPFFSGFYSKDLIINWTCIYENWVAKSVYLLLLSAAFFTTFYSIKILYLAFYSTPRSCLKKVTAVAEDNSWNLIPILILTIFALISGYVFSDLFLGYGANSIFEVQLEKNYFSLVEFINFRKKFLPLFVAMSAVVFFFFFYKYFLNLFAELLKDSRLIFCYTRLQTFFNKKWYFDYFYYYIARFFMHISYNILFKNFDKGLFEKIMVKNVIWSILKLGEKVNFIQTGSLIDYFMYITYLVAILIIIIFAIKLNLTILLFLFIFYNLTMVLN